MERLQNDLTKAKSRLDDKVSTQNLFINPDLFNHNIAQKLKSTGQRNKDIRTTIYGERPRKGRYLDRERGHYQQISERARGSTE